MARKLAYWISTALVAVALLGSLTYLTGSEQVVSGFAKAGYPQHLRIVLGVMKPAAAVVLLVPGVPLMKEWAYAGVTFALVMAFISAYLGADPVWPMPLLLLALLIVSYVTRPAGRLHDSIHGDLGADNDLPHESLSSILLRFDQGPRGTGDKRRLAGLVT